MEFFSRTNNEEIPFVCGKFGEVFVGQHVNARNRDVKCFHGVEYAVTGVLVLRSA